MKKVLACMIALLAAFALAGCAQNQGGAPAEESPSGQPPAESGGETGVKTGLAVTAAFSGGDAAEANNGYIVSDVGLTAVTVGGDGVIADCEIDRVQARLAFDAEGVFATKNTDEFPGKNELGSAYGMAAASSIGREWNEQAAAFAAYCIGKTVDEIKNISIDEQGKAADAELAASCTLPVGGFIEGVEQAAGCAAYCGAQRGDGLKLAVYGRVVSIKDAGGGSGGTAEIEIAAAAITMNGDTISSYYADALPAVFSVDGSGRIATDLTVPARSKRAMGDDYGMKAASAIGKEWYEQADAFGAYTVGRTAEEAANIAVTETNAPADAELAASCTISVAAFQRLAAKAED